MAYSSYYAISLSLVLMAVSMPLTIHAQAPMQDPGVIMPGMDVQFIITSAGKIWSQPRLIDSIAYICTDVFPTISAAMPNIFQSSDWEAQCKLVEKVAGDLETTMFCEGLNSTFANLTGIFNSVMGSIQSNMSGAAGRRRRDTEADLAQMVNPDFMLATVLNITADIYGFKVENVSPTAICKAAVQKILVPSIPDQIAEFGSRLGAVYMPLGQYHLCDHWDEFVNGYAGSLGNKSSMFIEDLTLAIANAVGFSGRVDLCSQMDAASETGESAMRELSRTVIINAFKVITDAKHCSETASAVIDVLVPVMPQVAIMVSDESIYQYTGYESVDDICGQVGSSFSAYSKADHMTSLNMTILTIMSIIAICHLLI